MGKSNAALISDYYKVAHREMYPQGTEVVYSTWTPRTSRMEGVNEVVVFGVQAFVKRYLIDFFNENFFYRDKAEVVAEYKRMLKYSLGIEDPKVAHLEELWDLGFLPLSIKALPEGSVSPLRVPTMTIMNTDPRFFWLTNYIETIASCELWQTATSATISFEYRKILNAAAMKTVGDCDFVSFQGHDFSMRGMSSRSSAESSGMGHLLSFFGTDTIPAIMAAEDLYGADIEREMVGTSIPATEHSIQCIYGNDEDYIHNMISVVHPAGFVSVVADGYDFWDVIGRVLPKLKDEVMAREGKLVIRPDSGDPVKIICGDPESENELVRKGAVEALWDLFGGSVTKMGYKLLDSHIGLIYGDAITISRAREIVEKLAEKGFASINVVFGIGSYTFQFNTRDTFGFALKSTVGVVNGVEIVMFKDPKTDDGTKKSQKGRVAVLSDGDSFRFVDGLKLNDRVEGDLLVEIFRDGKLLIDQKFSDIRARLASKLS